MRRFRIFWARRKSEAGVCLPTERRILLAGVRELRDEVALEISARMVMAWASWPAPR